MGGGVRHISLCCHILGLTLANICPLSSHHTGRTMFPVEAKGQVLISPLPQLEAEQLRFVPPFTGLSLQQPHISPLCSSCRHTGQEG